MGTNVQMCRAISLALGASLPVSAHCVATAELPVTVVVDQSSHESSLKEISTVQHTTATSLWRAQIGVDLVFTDID